MPEQLESPSTTLALPRQELEELLGRKALVDEQITNIERQIYAFEGSYLEDTCNQGNVIRGFEGYLNLRPTGGMEKKKTRFKEGDRLFSLSSSTYQKSLDIQEQALSDNEDSLKKKKRKLDEEVVNKKGRPKIKEANDYGET